MKCICIGALTALVAVLATSAAQAQGSQGFAPASVGRVSSLTPSEREERRFIKDSMAISRLELEAAGLASARATDSRIRAFAASMVRQHQVTGNELGHLLNRHAMAPPMLENSQRKALNKLARLSGRKFERTYIEDIALGFQREDIRNFERARQTARDPALCEWIDRKLPVLRESLAAAEDIAPPGARAARRPDTAVMGSRAGLPATGQRVE